MAPPIVPDILNFGVAAEETWKARVLKEKLMATNWHEKWNWMLKEYDDMNKQLEQLKKMRSLSDRSKPIDMRACNPLPDTSSRVIGWLSHHPSFQLEIYGSYIKKIPFSPSK